MTLRLKKCRKEWPNGRPISGRAVAATRIMASRCRVQACVHRRRTKKENSAAMPKLSADRRSGGRRSARLEWRPSWRDENHGDAVDVLDGVRNQRQRHLRRLGDERGAQ